MNLHVTHTTTYTYADPVPICHNQVHLTPRESPWQRCLFHRLRIQPHPSTTGRRSDYFGNPQHYFSIHEAHRKLTLRAVSRVRVQERGPIEADDSPKWEHVVEALRSNASPETLNACQFVFDSPRVPRCSEFAEYALPSFPAARPIVEGVLDLTDRLHRDFRYDSGATSVHTPAMEAFKARHGVCQDFAHIQIGCLRSIGLAARYVSGYLLTQPPPGRPQLRREHRAHPGFPQAC